MVREAKIERKTSETNVSIKIELEGEGKGNISTGIGFLDHMLTLFCMHSMTNLDVTAQGDLQVDGHHTIEDIGIVLGQAILKALGDKKSIKRYGHAFVPMDEALAFVCIDISGRPVLKLDALFSSQTIGQFETQMVEEFFRAVAVNAGMTMHIKVECGANDHHKIEAIFKAFARAFKEAVTIDESIKGVMSTKGTL
ncbi:MAG: imidazoleglycerol-phosphate dehydratase HisB [Deltaproteobacteria bacterium]